jgi:Domain of unknown function (DUF2382)
MTVPSIDTVQSWQGRTMVDPAGDKLGTIDAIYLDDETGSLSQDDEAELYRHYGLEYSEHRADGGLTRSEEELRVGTETRERGRARLRKHLVIEQQTVMVPVSRIEVDGDQDQR